MRILNVEIPEKRAEVRERRINQSTYTSYDMVLVAMEAMRRITGDYCYVVERERLYWIARLDPSGKEVRWS